MELKFRLSSTPTPEYSVLIVPLWNWNFVIYCYIHMPLFVLIVPLWNWNEFIVLLDGCDVIVLIVPLWNWNVRIISVIRWWPCFNCTFMELKLRSETSSALNSTVLIVPLWNWNSTDDRKQVKQNNVLIVPLWNWNSKLLNALTIACMF